jgi:hypothetical protein
MSGELTGWKSGGWGAGGCWKSIRGVRYEISGGVDGFALWHTPHGYTKLISTYPTIADAKRAAHEHSRSKT